MRSVPEKKHSLETSTEVTPQEKVFLLNGDAKIPIDVKSISRYFLSFRYLGKNLIATDQPVKLLIRNNGQGVELGPCRIISYADSDGSTGRLVFLHDVYDLKCLFEDKKVLKLQSVFDDLPLLFAHKRRIKNSFKTYVADLKYDLQVYKNLFDELDSQFREEPDDIKKFLQNAIFDSEGRKFLRFFYDGTVELGKIVADFSREEHQVHGFYFRKQLIDFIRSCPLLARSNLKPRGYAGDSEMMRMIYDNGYEGERTFAKLLHKYTVGIPTGDSVRYRRKLIPEMLHKLQIKIAPAPEEKIRVLSVACGPAFEIVDILRSKRNFAKYHFSLLDQDPLALVDASRLISRVEKEKCAKAHVSYVNKSVRWMFGKKAFEQELGKFHFIYSMGLFDYLVPRVAQSVLNKLYQLLIPGGEMLVGNFHVSNPDQFSMEYWADWVLMLRTEEEFRNLFDTVPSADTSVIFDDIGIQMFLHIKRRADAA